MIDANEFNNFVKRLFELDDEDKLWQIYIHKVFNQSWDEWRSTFVAPKSKKETEKEIGAAISHSFDILQNLQI